MTALEKIGLEKLLHELYDAQKRCRDENRDRMEHERIFLKSNIENAIKIVKALEENSK